jgi:putative membrane protein
MFETLAGLPAFLTYFSVSVAVVVGYIYVYTWITPHDELELINKNVPGPRFRSG